MTLQPDSNPEQAPTSLPLHPHILMRVVQTVQFQVSHRVQATHRVVVHTARFLTLRPLHKKSHLEQNEDMDYPIEAPVTKLDLSQVAVPRKKNRMPRRLLFVAFILAVALGGTLVIDFSNRWALGLLVFLGLMIYKLSPEATSSLAVVEHRSASTKHTYRLLMVGIVRTSASLWIMYSFANLHFPLNYGAAASLFMGKLRSFMACEQFTIHERPVPNPHALE
ncbi:MAG: hypothetical protein H7222_13840 [Methylotenera sp.]|nr:hypothetical protein [Oligoflexia bacterium]